MALIQAIREKHVVSFFYDGYQRTVEPHALGIDTQDNEALCAWQLTGKPGAFPAWRFYLVSKMNGITVQASTFPRPRDGYSKNDERLRNIYAQL